VSAFPELPPELDETDRLIEALRPLSERRRSREYQESLVLLRAIRLALDLRTCEAILRGEKVPLSRVDPEWAKAYGCE
jgi:hypothetical protein